MTSSLAFWIAFAVAAVCAVGLGWCVAWLSKDRRKAVDVFEDPDRQYRLTRIESDFIQINKGKLE